MSNERYALNKQLAQMLKGGVIMDVTTKEQAEAICNNWKNSNEDVYAYLMDILLK